jgi:antitoxin ParD1/3/4
MSRQSISLTPPNEAWLKAQIASQEYTSKSKLVNDLIRKARKDQQEVDYIRARLIDAEQSGFVDAVDPQAMLARFKKNLRDHGEL